VSITFGDIDGLRDQIYEGLKLVMKLKELKMRKKRGSTSECPSLVFVFSVYFR